MRTLALALCLLASCCLVQSKKKPNVIMMLADDMGYDDLPYVNREVIAPNIQKLALEGVILNNNYVQNLCTPTRHALMTGRYPFKTRFGHLVIFPLQQLCTPLDIDLMPQYMKRHGYKTYMAGKWHLGFCREECLPTNRGFDEFLGLWQGEQDYYTLSSGSSPAVFGFDWRNGTKIDWPSYGTFNMYLLNNWVVDHIRNYDSDMPFFMYLAWTAPHTPHEPTQKYYDYYSWNDNIQPEERKDYLGLVTALDDAVGNMTQALKDKGLYDNTIILFSSDNGGEHGQVVSNGQYRGSKGSLFEGGIRALAFAHGKMLKKVGYRHDGLFHVTDWLPTIMGLIGDDCFDAEEYDLDGYDQSRMILYGEPSKRDEVVFNIDMRPMSMMGQAAIRKGKYKFIWGSYGASDGWRVDQNLTLFYEDEAIRARAGLGPYQGSGGEEKRSLHKRGEFDFSDENKAEVEIILRLFRFDRNNIDSGDTYLFDLEDDPFERVNLAREDRYRAKVLELKQYILGQLRDYREPTVAQLFNNPAGNPTNFNGTWETGWCNDVEMTLESSMA